MRLTHLLLRSSSRFLGGAALVLSVLPLASQTIELSPAGPGMLAPVHGDHLAVPELPAPLWLNQTGTLVASLRLRAADTAAWRLDFRSLALAKGAQLFLYGLNSGGEIRSVHGPYEGNGPVNLQGFATAVIEGSELSIEVRGRQDSDAWPFEIEFIERISATQLDAIRGRGVPVEAVHRPQQASEPAGVVRSAWVEDQLVQYKVVDGKAVTEGDIVLGPADEVESGMRAHGGKSNGRRESHDEPKVALHWPNGVIPYVINYTPMFTTTGIVPGSTLDESIQRGIEMWNTVFPGMFVPRTNQKDYVSIVRMAGTCQAELGRTGGKQFVWVSDSCSAGMIAHEFGHSLGFWHEHQRPDRDNFVTIRWENIDPDVLFAFQLPSAGETRVLGAYDYGSLMHYSRTQGGLGGKITITPPPSTNIGQRKEISTGDQYGVRARYCNPSVWPLPGLIYEGSDASSGTFKVTAPPYCTWSISSLPSWLTISGALTRTGTQTMTYSVPNTFRGRIGEIVIKSTGIAKIRFQQEGENIRF